METTQPLPWYRRTSTIIGLLVFFPPAGIPLAWWAATWSRGAKLVAVVACLPQESGVWRLFTFWGGEALYMAHERDAAVAPLLRRLGTACIVEAAVPVGSVNRHHSVAEKLLVRFLRRRGVVTDQDPDMEGNIQHQLDASHIRRVIRRADADFERLTRCSKWQESPT